MADQCILTLNGGSSSIKFALFKAVDPARRLLSGTLERIGHSDATLRVESDDRPAVKEQFNAADHAEAAEQLMAWLQQRQVDEKIECVGHRIVHGGVHLLKHQAITPDLVKELRRAVPLDLAHLPGELALIDRVSRHYPKLPQFACFDTAFHRDLPRVAQLLPIPRRYLDAGVRRLGFHGLSFTFLLNKLRRIGKPGEADGRVILAHLGAGASLSAVHKGHPIDTSMAFTPTAGLVMATRPGDLDPGLLMYLMREENLSSERMDEFLNRLCGLVGVSESSPDMRDLLARRDTDVRAAEAVDLFCYQAKKWIGSFAAALGGLDTLVFAAGIGENSPATRAQICEGLDFLGLRLNSGRNQDTEPLISTDDSRVAVRVMRTDEESVIAGIASSLHRLRGPHHG